MTRPRLLPLLALWLAPAAATLAQAPAPDLSTPRSAAVAFGAALTAADAAGIRGAAVGTADEYARAEAVGGMLAAFRRLAEAAAARFGREKVVFRGAAAADVAADLDRAEVTVDGDAATVAVKDGRPDPMRLRRAGGSWRVDLSSAPREAARLAALAPALAAAADEVAADVRANRFRSVEDAQAALAAKAAAAMSRAGPPPATGPGVPAPRR